MNALQNIQTVLDRLNQDFPSSIVLVNGKQDLPEHYSPSERKGTHLNVEVKSHIFEGIVLIDQHRMVHNSLTDLMQINGGFIHALTIKTRKKDNWQ